MGIRILGTGSYLPPKVVTNDDIAAALDTSDEWIYSHTGIHARHVAEDGETTSTMGAKAAKAALEMAKVAPEEIGLIVLATSTPDYATFPSTACVVPRAMAGKALRTRMTSLNHLQSERSSVIWASSEGNFIGSSSMPEGPVHMPGAAASALQRMGARLFSSFPEPTMPISSP
jgi:3-oxoacyl-[acyl-carrier-protein] synthase III